MENQSDFQSEWKTLVAEEPIEIKAGEEILIQELPGGTFRVVKLPPSQESKVGTIYQSKQFKNLLVMCTGPGECLDWFSGVALKSDVEGFKRGAFSGAWIRESFIEHKKQSFLL